MDSATAPAPRPAPRPSPRRVDLNADLGEEVTDDVGLLAVVTSANVACGYHAGTPAVMRAVCDEAAARGTVVGAQVSYADREHFGRVARDVPHHVLRDQVADQVGLLSSIAVASGTRVRYVKAHGALYHRVLDDPDQAGALLDGSGDLPVLSMPGLVADLAAERGRQVVREDFPDRRHDAAGRLVARSQPGAVLREEHEVVAQALALAGGAARSLCLHGDTPGAVGLARAVRTALQDDGWELRAALDPSPA